MLRRSSFVLIVGVFPLVVACVPKGGTSAPSSSADEGPPAGNLLKNATFASGATLPWNPSFSPPASGSLAVNDGAACLTIREGGVNKWDAQLRHREMVMQQGHTYTVAFKIWADKATLVRPKVGQAVTPYAEFWHQTVNVTTTPQVVRGGFIHEAADDPNVEFAFHMGGNLLRETQLPVTVCIDDVYLTDPQFSGHAGEEAVSLPAIRINQLGYIPSAKKIATVVNRSKEALDWKLLYEGEVVAEGKTQTLGPDAESGDSVHLIDFTSFKESGEGFILSVGEDVTSPFSITEDLYADLKYDALRYFYHNRSGIEIKMPYAKHERWTRPAGHAKSDKKVPCGKDTGCDYSLDVSGGWYDAGDHGKYVVNGGISVWTLMNQYERFSIRGSAKPFSDSTLEIPESGNGVPDLLDEARWEMEFLLKMQVPPGKPNAGMVHHKIHDTVWTALGLAPHEAENATTRNLRPVSTAATLNLAATAAQAARLFEKYDPTFSERCLAAAEKAWAAAKKNPSVFADPNDGQSGGGPYGDGNVADEFYWAAAELFITTKKPTYKAELTASKYWKDMSTGEGGVPTSMTWASTDALGTISLALVSGALPPAEQKALQGQIVDAADKFNALARSQGYRVPFAAGPDGKYPWGSNSFVLNNMIILALAYDFTSKDEYLETVILGMDYLLGRNAMAQSYVSGYGTNPLKNPHHRFWAQQANAKYPPAPPGAVSGGPNSSLQDPYVQGAGLAGCAPQKCFLDHIEAWSVNEITINWNAPLAWVAAYLDENAGRARAK